MQSRRDPRDSGLAEQGLYEQLAMLFDAQAQDRLVQVAIQGKSWFQNLVVTPEETRAFCAPLVEELVFRGLLYGWLAGRWGKTAGWIVSSLAFAAAHTEPAHIILVFPLGLLFGWLRQRTDSLLPSLVAHIANNALALVAAAYLDS